MIAKSSLSVDFPIHSELLRFFFILLNSQWHFFFSSVKIRNLTSSCYSRLGEWKSHKVKSWISVKMTVVEAQKERNLRQHLRLRPFSHQISVTVLATQRAVSIPEIFQICIRKHAISCLSGLKDWVYDVPRIWMCIKRSMQSGWWATILQLAFVSVGCFVKRVTIASRWINSLLITPPCFDEIRQNSEERSSVNFPFFH